MKPPPTTGTPSSINSVPGRKPERLDSLDAFRGAVILVMISSGLGLAGISKSFPDSSFWQTVGYHSEHAVWAGATLWDLIQPAFMFMVGVALPWSVSNRLAKGERFGQMAWHAVLRSTILILLALFLGSAWSNRTEWSFTNVLAQIGLGYPFLFLLAFTGRRTPWIAAGGLLAAYWLLFALHPLPATDYNWQAAGIPESWPHLKGFAAHWEKNANFASAFDVWFLNLFPRSQEYVFNTGGYHTLNFIPSLATMIFGLLSGRMLRTNLPVMVKLPRLVVAGVAGIVIGIALDWAGICPIVKRIWTPSWVLFSTGWVVLMLAVFIALVDWRGWKRPAFPLIVAGFNPIALYCLWQLSGGFIRKQVKIHLGGDFFHQMGVTWVPFMERAVMVLILWLIAWWMYRKKIFLRI